MTPSSYPAALSALNVVRADDEGQNVAVASSPHFPQALDLPLQWDLTRRQANGGGGGGGNGSATGNGTTLAPPGNTTQDGPPPQQNMMGQGGTPLSVFTFVIAVALFALVISFVLFRTWRSRRRGLQFDGNHNPDSIARFLGLTGKIEDHYVPPKLWEARFVPPPSNEKSQSQVQMDAKSMWTNLMPLAASLPVSLYLETGAAADGDSKGTAATGRDTAGQGDSSAVAGTNGGAAKDGAKEEEDKQKKNNDKDPQEPMPGSVNVSVLIAMPSPPKNKDALPELMLGTAAVPILVSPPRFEDVGPAASSSRAAATPTGSTLTEWSKDGRSEVGYFPPPAPPMSAQRSQPPTRAQLLALIDVARRAKEQQRAASGVSSDATQQAAENQPAGDEAAVTDPQARTDGTPGNGTPTGVPAAAER
ncbi:unnamed protein product [Parajaminaea phylloscopi]